MRNYFDHSFLGMGDGGAAPMQQEVVEDEACDLSDEYITRGEKKGTCWELKWSNIGQIP